MTGKEYTDAYPPMPSEWVIGKFKGQQAQSVLDHANAGMGYYIKEHLGRGQTLEVVAAFRRPKDSPLPDHLELANHYQVQKLEARRQK